jgi:hypothetical protein
MQYYDHTDKFLIKCEVQCGRLMHRQFSIYMDLIYMFLELHDCYINTNVLTYAELFQNHVVWIVNQRISVR